MGDSGTGSYSHCYRASSGHSSLDQGVQWGLHEPPGFRDKDWKEPGALSDYKDSSVSCYLSFRRMAELGREWPLRNFTRKQAERERRTAGGWSGDVARNFCSLKWESQPRVSFFYRPGKLKPAQRGKEETQQRDRPLWGNPQNRCGNVSLVQDVGRRERESGQGQAHTSLWWHKSKEKQNWEPQFLRKVFPWGKRSRGNMRRTKFWNSHNREKQNKQFLNK